MRIVLLSLAGLTVFTLLARPLLENKVIVDGDLGRAHLPSRDFYQRCLHNGDDYSWCPGQFCGYFIHGEGQGGYDHPLHQILYRCLPLVPAFNLEVWLNYPFMLVGTFLFLRRHQLSREASLFGALSFTFSGFNLPHYPHTNAIAIVAHIPWLLWAIDILWRSESPRQRAWAQLAITLLTASQILLGYPQYLWFSAMAEGLYVLVMMRHSFLSRPWKGGVGEGGSEPSTLLGNPPLPLPKREGIRRLGLFALAKCLGLLTGAAQLLPSLEALRDSPRMGYSNEFRCTFSLNPAQLLQLIAPSMFNEAMQMHEYTVYAGAFASLLAVWWFIRPKQPASILQSWAIALLACSIPLALGKYTALFRVYLKLPIVGVFRCPCRYLVLAHLAAAVLMAVAANQLRQQEKPTSWKRLAWLAVIPALGAVIAIWCAPHLGSEMQLFVTSQHPWCGVIALSIAAVLFALAGRGCRRALTALMVFTIADQAAYGLKSIRLYRTADLAGYCQGEEKPPGPVFGRIELGDVYGNALQVCGMKLTSGYVGLTPPRLLDYSTDETQRVAGTSWRHDGTTWHPIDGLPRVRLLTQAKVSSDPRADLATIDPSQTVLLDRNVNVPPSEPGTCEVIVDRPGHVEILTSTRTLQVLVFTESFHEAWHATIDGEPVEILRAYGDFQACEVPPGKHRVEFRFVDASVTWGRRLSLAGLVCSVGLFFWVKEPRMK
ncbi:MAG: YfhO family protein [Gemmataceae bacterium]